MNKEAGMAEWTNAQALRACHSIAGGVGSNPTPGAFLLNITPIFDETKNIVLKVMDRVEDVHFYHRTVSKVEGRLCGLNGEVAGASHFYYPLNNFHYTIFRFDRLLFMVGFTASESKMLEYVRRMVHKLIELWLKTYF